MTMDGKPGMAEQDVIADPKIVVYHDIWLANGRDVEAAQRNLRRQLVQMADMGHTFASVEDLLSGADLTDGNVLITFDDGYDTIPSCALPVLKELGVPAAVFLVAGFAGRHGYEHGYLSWQEAKELSKEELITFGSHSLSHVPLDQVKEERMRHEIVGSKEMFRRHGMDARFFAYPYGRHDDRVKEIIADAGYQAAFSVVKGGKDRFEFRRRMMSGTENAALTSLFMTKHFFDYFNALTWPIPGRFAHFKRPIPRHRWGPESSGIFDWEGSGSRGV